VKFGYRPDGRAQQRRHTCCEDRPTTHAILSSTVRFTWHRYDVWALLRILLQGLLRGEGRRIGQERCDVLMDC